MAETLHKIDPEDYLMHYGIKGQKWGVRRFQNPDGSLTAKGMKRYNRYAKKDAKKWAKAQQDYGTGAGIKRRHLKARMETHQKEGGEYYKTQFDKHYEEQKQYKEKYARQSHRRKVGREFAKECVGRTVGSLGAAIVIGGTYIATHPEAKDVLMQKIRG
jgi:hypothetical protein